MKKLAITASCIAALVAVVDAAGYTTAFPLTENPISESGNWTNGKAVGLDWSNVRTTPGLAFGTQSGPAGPPYNDSLAVLQGTWLADQMATATVHTVNQKSGSVYEEVELLLRFNITPHTARGYEFNFSCRHDGSQYAEVVRWNGALNDWTILKETTGPGLKDGDQVKATAVGNKLTLYINNVAVVSVNDSTFPTGNPGMGFYLQGMTGVNADYGFTSYSASSLTPPTAPTNLRIIRP